MKKKILSIVLAFVMVLSFFPGMTMMASAAGESNSVDIRTLKVGDTVSVDTVLTATTNTYMFYDTPRYAIAKLAESDAKYGYDITGELGDLGEEVSDYYKPSVIKSTSSHTVLATVEGKDDTEISTTTSWLLVGITGYDGRTNNAYHFVPADAFGTDLTFAEVPEYLTLGSNTTFTAKFNGEPVVDIPVFMRVVGGSGETSFRGDGMSSSQTLYVDEVETATELILQAYIWDAGSSKFHCASVTVPFPIEAKWTYTSDINNPDFSTQYSGQGALKNAFNADYPNAVTGKTLYIELLDDVVLDGNGIERTTTGTPKIYLDMAGKKITVNGDANDYTNPAGIYYDSYNASLTVKNGTMIVNAVGTESAVGIECEAALILEDLTINVYGTTSGADGVRTTSDQYGDLTMTRCNITVESASTEGSVYGVFGVRNLTMTDCNINVKVTGANENTYGVYFLPSGSGTNASNTRTVTATNNTIVVHGAGVQTCGIHAENHQVLVSGGTIKATGDGASYGIYNQGAKVKLAGDAKISGETADIRMYSDSYTQVFAQIDADNYYTGTDIIGIEHFDTPDPDYLSEYIVVNDVNESNKDSFELVGVLATQYHLEESNGKLVFAEDAKPSAPSLDATKQAWWGFGEPGDESFDNYTVAGDLTAAFTAANRNTDTTNTVTYVKLMNDVELSSTLSLDRNKSMVLDMSDGETEHKITATNNKAIYTNFSTNLVVKNGTIIVNDSSGSSEVVGIETKDILTVSNCNIQVTGTKKAYGIKVNSNITVTVEGASEITGIATYDSQYEDVWGYGIYGANSSCTIKVIGQSIITGRVDTAGSALTKACGIATYGNLTVNNSTVQATSGASAYAIQKLNTSATLMEVSNSKLSATATTYSATGIDSNSPLAVTGGTISAVSKNNNAKGIIVTFGTTLSVTDVESITVTSESTDSNHSAKGIEITSSNTQMDICRVANINVTAKAGEATGIYGTTLKQGNTAHIENCTINAMSDCLAYGVILNFFDSSCDAVISDCNIVATATDSMAYGIFTGISKMLVSGGSITATAPSSSYGIDTGTSQSAIYLGDGVEISGTTAGVHLRQKNYSNLYANDGAQTPNYYNGGTVTVYPEYANSNGDIVVYGVSEENQGLFKLAGPLATTKQLKRSDNNLVLTDKTSTESSISTLDIDINWDVLSEVAVKDGSPMENLENVVSIDDAGISSVSGTLLVKMTKDNVRDVIYPGLFHYVSSSDTMSSEELYEAMLDLFGGDYWIAGELLNPAYTLRVGDVYGLSVVARVANGYSFVEDVAVTLDSKLVSSDEVDVYNGDYSNPAELDCLEFRAEVGTIKDMTGDDTLERAKAAIEEALAGMTATNDTTQETLQALAESALSGANITGVSVMIVGFNKQEATDSESGYVEGYVQLLAPNSDAVYVTIDKTIVSLVTEAANAVWVFGAVDEAPNYADAASGTLAQALAAANDAANSGKGALYIKLSGDVTSQSGYALNGKVANVVIDLGGNTLAINSESQGIEATNCKVTIKNGSLDITAKDLYGIYSDRGMELSGLTSLEIDGSAARYDFIGLYAPDAGAAVSISGGTNGGTMSITGSAQDCYGIHVGNGGTVTIQNISNMTIGAVRYGIKCNNSEGNLTLENTFGTITATKSVFNGFSANGITVGNHDNKVVKCGDDASYTEKLTITDGKIAEPSCKYFEIVEKQSSSEETYLIKLDASNLENGYASVWLHNEEEGYYSVLNAEEDSARLSSNSDTAMVCVTTDEETAPVVTVNGVKVECAGNEDGTFFYIIGGFTKDTVIVINPSESDEDEPETPTYSITVTVMEEIQNPEDSTDPYVVCNDATVTIVSPAGGTIATAQTVNGECVFEGVPRGIYNVVVTKGEKVKTVLVTVDKNVSLPVIKLPLMKINSMVDVKIEVSDDSLVKGASAGGLDELADRVAVTVEKNHNEDVSVEVEMTIDTQMTGSGSAQEQQKIEEVVPEEKKLTFLDITIDLTVKRNGVEQPNEGRNIRDAGALLEIVIPFDMDRKTDFVVYRHHVDSDVFSNEVQVLDELIAGEDPNTTEHIEIGTDTITMYVRYFSTYAIGYTETLSDDDDENDGEVDVPAVDEDETPEAPQIPQIPVIPDITVAPSYSLNVVDGIKGGTVRVSGIAAIEGATVTFTVTPNRGYELANLSVLDSFGNEVSLTSIGDGKYTFIMPDGQVYINATFRADVSSCTHDGNCPVSVYTDINVNAWYHDGVHYCIDHGLMEGMPNGSFEPNGITTRAQIVTILWRLEGEIAVNRAMSFEDVAAGKWYTEAVRWAAANGIVEGFSETVFAPNEAIAREQMAAILWRYCQYKGIDVSVGEETNILSYADAFDVHSWAMSAMQWACGAGVIGGIADGNSMKLDPDGTAIRAQVATMLQRLCTEIVEP